MKKLLFRKDDDGSNHFSKHDVSEEEVRELFFLVPIKVERLQNKRFAVYGKLSSGRFLMCYYTKVENLIEVQTCYDIQDEMMRQDIDKICDF